MHIETKLGSRGASVAALAFVATLALFAAGCSDTPTASGSDTRILSAFFGLDDGLPTVVNALCDGRGGGMDGMPAVFAGRVVRETLDPGDFSVETRSGRALTPICATLAPALDPSERHTVLLVGDLGDAVADPPVRVRIVGSLELEGGGDANGASVAVTPLDDGPSLVLALRYAPGDLAGSTCPAATRQVVQVTFAGGVRSTAGRDLGAAELERFRIRVESPTGERQDLVPDALADLGDMDNYVQLCLADDRRPVSVALEAGTVIDPNGDPNPDTEARITDASADSA